MTISVFLVEKLKSNPFQFCYGPSLIETPNDLVAVFQAGNERRATDLGIWISRSLPEYKWTKAVQVFNPATDQTAEGSANHCSNPVLFRYPDGRILLFFRVSGDLKTWRGMWRKSADEGKTWSKAQPLAEGFVGPTKNKPQLLPDGSLLCGSSTEDQGWQVHFERLNPDGIWTKSPPVNDGRKTQGIEPALLFHGNNRWQAIGRSTKGQGRIFDLWSNDGAETWSEMNSLDLPNPGSSLDAITLKDGRIVLVYNHSSDERTPLNVAISEDGKNWKAVLILEVDGNESTYPSVIQASNGIVHIAYCSSRRHIRHYAFDPAKVRLQSIVEGKWPIH